MIIIIITFYVVTGNSFRLTKKKKKLLVHIKVHLGMYQSEVDPRPTMTSSQFLCLYFLALLRALRNSNWKKKLYYSVGSFSKRSLLSWLQDGFQRLPGLLLFTRIHSKEGISLAEKHLPKHTFKKNWLWLCRSVG